MRSTSTYHDAAGFYALKQTGERRRGVWQVEQDVSAHKRVESIAGREPIDFCLFKGHPRRTAVLYCPSASVFQEARILIDADNAAVRADDLGGEHGDITYAGTDVQHAHSGHQTRSSEEPLCRDGGFAPGV